MIDKFDKIETPTDTSPFVLNVKDGDTVVLKVDSDKYDVNEAHQFCEAIKNAFPKNGIVCTFNGLEIEGVIRNEFKQRL